MNHYAILDATSAVLWVNHAEAPPAGDAGTWVELVAFSGWPDQPEGWTVQVQGGALVAVDLRSLGEAKAAQWETIKAARGAAIAAGFTWDGSKFDSDDQSVGRIQGAVQLAVLSAAAGQPFAIDWTLFDNSTRTLTGGDMISIGVSLGAFVAAAFATGVSLRDQVNAATTLDAVKAISWPP